jgi:hypothetical protein
MLVFLLMRQIMPIASGLAGGLALSSLGAISGTLSRAIRMGGRQAGDGAIYAARTVYATVASRLWRGLRASARSDGDGGNASAAPPQSAGPSWREP